jgi:hypothetical protein
MPKLRAKWKPVQISTVDEVVAEDWWEYYKHGRKYVSRVAVGKPTPDPSGQDWYCPLLFENELDGWKAIYGVGPVDALMNATLFIRLRFNEYYNTKPHGGKKPKGAGSGVAVHAPKRRGKRATPPLARLRPGP